MTRRDPIATATLAQLYIAQGHAGKATKVLADVLEDNPLDGAALHLMSRLVDHRPALTLSVDAREIQMSWQGASHELHAVLVCFAGSAPFGGGSPPGVRRPHAPALVTSARCREAFGEAARPRPWARGTAVACLARTGSPGSGFLVHAIAQPVSWAYR